MSHVTCFETQFQNLFYLEKALNRLNIAYKKTFVGQNLNPNLEILESSGNNNRFSWNEEDHKYDFLGDISLWKETYSATHLIDQVAQQYAGEFIIGEGQKTGFQPVKYKQNSDGSNTLVLERFKIPTFNIKGAL